MAKGRRRDEWERWANWMTLYAECHRDSKKRSKPYTPVDFMPAEFCPKQTKQPMAKMSLRQYAATIGQQIIADAPTIITGTTDEPGGSNSGGTSSRRNGAE